jgi:hypothetical protein
LQKPRRKLWARVLIDQGAEIQREEAMEFRVATITQKLYVNTKGEEKRRFIRKERERENQSVYTLPRSSSSFMMPWIPQLNI